MYHALFLARDGTGASVFVPGCFVSVLRSELVPGGGLSQSGVMSARHTVFRDLLKRRDFMKLWMGQVISSLGDRFYQFALLSIVLGAESGQLEIGAGTAQVLFWAMIFTVVLAPWIGRVVDSYSRKVVMLVTDFGRAALLLGLLVLWWVLGEQAASLEMRWVVLCFVAAIGLLNGVFIPARQASVSALVSREELVRANALVTTVGVIASLVGASASFIVALLGEVSVFVLAAAGFCTSGIFILLISNSLMPGNCGEVAACGNRWWSEISDALGYLARHSVARVLVALAGLGQFAVGLLVVFGLSHALTAVDLSPARVALAPALEVVSSLTGQALEFGEKQQRIVVSVGLLVCTAVGLLLGVVLCGKVWRVGHYAALPFLGVLLLGLAVVGFASAGSLAMLFACSVPLGLGGALIATPIDARLQAELPGDKLGRVFSLRAAVMNIAFILAMAINLDGRLIEIFGATKLLLLLGVSLCGTAVVLALSHADWLKSLWGRVRGPECSEPQSH